MHLPDRLVAHTPPDGGDWHYLDDHTREVARLAVTFAAAFGAQWIGWFAGVLHDAGKADDAFQQYLLANANEPDRKHPTVDHKTCGALYSAPAFADREHGELLYQILLGHHGGLPDRGEANVKIRDAQERRVEHLADVFRRFVSEPGIAAQLAETGTPSLPAWLTDDPHEIEFFLRMVFSCLVDADHLDTEAHRNPRAADRRRVERPSIEQLWERFQQDQARFTTPDVITASEVNRVRHEVYEAALEKALLPPGFFRLTVPTGGGKTRTGLAFALRHAVAHQRSRIIVAVPFITITDQTARVYRDALQLDHAVLEHHSGIEPVSRDDDGSATAQEIWRRLASQNWDVPLVVTTTVQLFESLFANRTTACRKLHNLANSVIILDEIQTVPPDLRGPLFAVFRELVAHYGVTIVLSTATQPVLDTIAPQLVADGREIVEIAPDPARLFRTLERVTYEWPFLEETWSWPEVVDRMREHDQVLTIVNTIADAQALYRELDDDDALHLSTRMCQAHRRDVLNEIRVRLREGRPCRVVSTQLVEAGVDLDFPVVMRAVGPLDRIVQAAGRCNREGRHARGQVIVFSAETDRNMPGGSYRQGAQQMEQLVRQPGFDANDPSIFTTYFSQLYGLQPEDGKEIQRHRSSRNYETVASEFRMIEDDTFTVLVNYPDDGQRDAVLRDLRRSVHRPAGPIRELYQRAQPYLVNCRVRDQQKYAGEGLIEEIVPGLWEWRGDYDLSTGLSAARVAPDQLYV